MPPTRVVGQFEIVRELGRGGMAIVYLARQRALDRDVALKELLPLHSGDPAFASRFLRESRIAGSLSHPNIVTVHDYFEHEGVPFIAMEFVPRGSLRPVVRDLTLGHVAGVMEGLLAALTYAAGRGVVHRDLKPENLMITSEGTIKVTDFGIAKAFNDANTGALTMTGTTVGTPAYMAPEQAMGRGVDHRADIYAAGVMAYELLLGRVPFHDADTPMAVLLRHVSEPPPPPLEVRPDLDPRLAHWLERMLAKDPAERPQSARRAWEELEDIVESVVGARWRRDARLAPGGETSQFASALPSARFSDPLQATAASSVGATPDAPPTRPDEPAFATWKGNPGTPEVAAPAAPDTGEPPADAGPARPTAPPPAATDGFRTWGAGADAPVQEASPPAAPPAEPVASPAPEAPTPPPVEDTPAAQLTLPPQRAPEAEEPPPTPPAPERTRRVPPWAFAVGGLGLAAAAVAVVVVLTGGDDTPAGSSSARTTPTTTAPTEERPPPPGRVPVAAGGAGGVFMSDPAGRVLRLTGGRVDGRASLPGGARAMVAHGGDLVVAGAGEVVRYDRRHLRVLADFRAPDLTVLRASGSTGVLGLTPSSGGRLCGVKDDGMGSCVELGFLPGGLALGNGRAFITDPVGRRVVAVRATPSSLRPDAPITLGSALAGPAVVSSARLFVAVDHGVAVVNPATGATERTVALSGTPVDLITARSGRVFAALYSARSVAMIDPLDAAAAPVSTPVEGAPVALTGGTAVSGDGRSVLAVDEGGGVSAIDPLSGSASSRRRVRVGGPRVAPAVVGDVTGPTRGDPVTLTIHVAGGHLDAGSVTAVDTSPTDGRVVFRLTQPGIVTRRRLWDRGSGVSVAAAPVPLGTVVVTVGVPSGAYARADVRPLPDGTAIRVVLTPVPPTPTPAAPGPRGGGPSGSPASGSGGSQSPPPPPTRTDIQIQ